VDDQDYNADILAKDDTIKEFIRETSILQSLKDNQAQNVNVIYDAFSVDTQLWIVSEYCPGGSLTTLMKATPRPGLDEEFIIPIAREVAIALKYVHEAGIIHRDIKCANILVTEDGRIQLCDFGISGVLENEVSKRSTIVGTPHWMAPELVSHLGSDMHGVRYGNEIDCWAFGCAVFEMATGHPPNARVRAENLGVTLHVRAPRLEEDKYSAPLREFAAFCLEQRPEMRPTAEQIMQHQYIANTSQEYPTESIRGLLENYAVWEQSGGQRMSLFNPMGPAGPEALSPQDEPDEEWNFSSTMEFDRRISMHLDNFPDVSADPGKEIYGFEKIIEEARSKRGERVLGRLFDPQDKPYSYGERSNRISDLPLRSYSDKSNSDRMTLIDLDAVIPTFDEIPSLELVDPPTLRARARKVKEERDSDAEIDLDDAAFQTARPATQEWTMNLIVDPPADNMNRRTQDWTFPKMAPEELTPPTNQTSRRVPKDSMLGGPDSFKESLANRRTQDWKFPSAEEMEVAALEPRHTAAYSASDAMQEPPRPNLKHAATMPIEYGAHSFTSDNSGASSPDRASLIDLDSALVIDIPTALSRPSTSHSATNSAATDMTSGDPFDLEEQITLSKENSRTSLHMKSQSEPTAGFLDSNSREDSRDYGSDFDSVHNRSSSMNRSDRDRSTSRPAGMSSRYHPSRPTALQKHWAEKHPGQPSSGSVTGSRAGSFDSTTTDVNDYNMSWDSFGDTEEETLRDETASWQSRLGARSRRQKPSDGASTISVTSDEYVGATIKPLRIGGGGSSGSNARVVPPLPVLPYEPDSSVLLSGDEELMVQEISRMIDNFVVQAEGAQQALRYFGSFDDTDLQNMEDELAAAPSRNIGGET
jgi:protein-serine/threonine kinase